jgi:phage-related protein
VGTVSFPILYEPGTTDFENNGIGILSDCVSCLVSETRNGAFDLVMNYPTGGIHFEEITYHSIIKVQLEKERNPQLFRIWYIYKPMFGNAIIKANHISYDLSGIPVRPFSASSLNDALIQLKENVPEGLTGPYSNNWIDRFSFETNNPFANSAKKYDLILPASIRAVLGGLEKSILSEFRGEFEFDNFNVKLLTERGKDNGVSIRYGSNLTNLQQEINCANFATAFYFFWSVENENGTRIVESDIVMYGTDDDVPELWDLKVATIDLSGEISEEDFPEDFTPKEYVEAVGGEYVRKNGLDKPAVNLSLTYAQLQQNEEYKDSNWLEQIKLCDTISVVFPKMGISAKAKVTKLVYDALHERVDSAVVGSVKTDIADTIAAQGKAIDALKKSVRK